MTTVRAGVDVGGTKMQAAIVNARGAVVGEARRPTPGRAPAGEVVAELDGVVRDALANAGLEPSSLTGVGVGWPGPVDEAAGTVSRAVHVLGLKDGFALSEALGEAVGAPVRVGNDVQVATNAEHSLGAGRGFGSILGVFWGTGVGGGIVLDGKPWTGRGSAAEIGHVVVRENGRRCPCGRRGCMEAYAGRAAMEARARRAVARGRQTMLFEIMEQRGRDRLTSGVWERALQSGDPVATRLMNRAVRALGTGVASALNVLDVEAVVIGGGLGVRLGPAYLERITAEIMTHAFAPEPPDVRIAELGDLGGAIGASLLVKTASRSRKPAASQ
ncbi:MAG TPA: ROK family protein [Solirubrobacterales bacterium]|nr:ROK family protein [Solirubrobacterales bacterium]